MHMPAQSTSSPENQGKGSCSEVCAERLGEQERVKGETERGVHAGAAHFLIWLKTQPKLTEPFSGTSLWAECATAKSDSDGFTLGAVLVTNL